MSLDGQNCPICGVQMRFKRKVKYERATADHFVPRSRGGRNHSENRWVICARCNTAKGSKWPGIVEIAAFARVKKISSAEVVAMIRQYVSAFDA